MKTGADRVYGGEQGGDRPMFQIPDPADDELVIETLFTCISPGTESRLLSARQGGLEQYPFIPGYANVGRVIGRGQLALCLRARSFSQGAQAASQGAGGCGAATSPMQCSIRVVSSRSPTASI